MMKKIDIFDVVFKHKQFLEKSLYDGGKNNNIVYGAALETIYAYPILWSVVILATGPFGIILLLIFLYFKFKR